MTHENARETRSLDDAVAHPTPPPESTVERFLTAHAEHESMRSLRDSAVWSVALSSVGVAFVAEWPDLASDSTRDGLLALWGLAFAALVVLTIFEFRLRRRIVSQIASVERIRRNQAGAS